jgi:hypothetical protein
LEIERNPDDGLHWRKPALEIYDSSTARVKKESHDDIPFRPRDGVAMNYRGKWNNIIGFFGDGCTCFVDPHETDPAHCYKGWTKRLRRGGGAAATL